MKIGRFHLKLPISSPFCSFGRRLKNYQVNLNINVRPFLFRGNHRICHSPSFFVFRFHCPLTSCKAALRPLPTSSVLPNFRCYFFFYMKQALRAVPYMAISSESLLSAVMDMEGTQKYQWHRCFNKRFLCLSCIPWENNH